MSPLRAVMLVALATSFALEARAEGSLAAGDRCQLSQPVPAFRDARGKAKRPPLRKDTELELLSIEGGWARVKAQGGAAFARLEQLEAKCVKAAAAPAAISEPVPIAPVVAAPIEAPASPAPEASPAPAAVQPAPRPESPPVPEPTPPLSVSEDSAGKIKVAVMALRTSAELPRELVESLTDLIPQTLEDLGPFKAITAADIQQMLAIEALKQSLGCDGASPSCLAEIGGAIGADYMITGSALAVGGSYLLQFQLMNIGQARVAQRVSREYAGGPMGLLDEVRTATKILVRELLAQKSGMLTVDVSEEGASIKIDGTIVGVSPHPSFAVAGGVHSVSVEKQGFILFARDVEITAKQETRVAAQLAPSEEYKRTYVASAGFTRAMAWTGIGAGAASLGGGVFFFMSSRSKASALRDDILAYNEPSHVRTPDEELALKNRRQGIATSETLAMIFGGAGAVGLAAGVLLYLNGDDPQRFDVVPGVEVPLALSPLVGPGVAGLGVSGTF